MAESVLATHHSGPVSLELSAAFLLLFFFSEEFFELLPERLLEELLFLSSPLSKIPSGSGGFGGLKSNASVRGTT